MSPGKVAGKSSNLRMLDDSLQYVPRNNNASVDSGMNDLQIQMRKKKDYNTYQYHHNRHGYGRNDSSNLHLESTAEQDHQEAIRQWEKNHANEIGIQTRKKKNFENDYLQYASAQQ